MEWYVLLLIIYLFQLLIINNPISFHLPRQEHLSVSAASDAAGAGRQYSRVGTYSNNSHRHQLPTVRSSLHPVNELEDLTDEGVQYLDDNNASAPREGLVDMDDVPDPNDVGNPPRSSQSISSLNENLSVATDATAPDNSSNVFTPRSSASPTNNSNTPGGEQSLCSRTVS